MENLNKLEVGLLDNLLSEKLDTLNNKLNTWALTEWQVAKLEEEKKELWALKNKLFQNFLGGE
jgi:hypothetical protein